MLRKTLGYSLAAILLFWIALLVDLTTIRSSDHENFQALLHQKSIKAEKNSLVQPITQIRQDVQKDIWFANETIRPHFRIRSKSSELALKIVGKKPEVIETLQDLECWIQDQLYYDSGGKKLQQLRYFTAEKGIYLFPSHRFLAEKVDLSFLRALGHELPLFLHPEQSFLNGYATDVSFFLSDKNPVFSARHLKAKIHPERGSL